MQEENSVQSTRYIPVTKWNEYHVWPSQAGLRFLIFNEKTNGFKSVIRRVNRRVLLDEQAFMTWVEDQNKKRNA
jgi:hypothetical protein